MTKNCASTSKLTEQCRIADRGREFAYALQEATVVMNQRTGKSKGFGFVEFREPGVRERAQKPKF